MTKDTDWVKDYEEWRWVKLSAKGLAHFNRKSVWNDRLRAAYLGKSDEYPELIKIKVRGEERIRHVHPALFEPAP